MIRNQTNTTRLRRYGINLLAGLLLMCTFASGAALAEWTYVRSLGQGSPGRSARGVSLSHDGQFLYFAGIQDDAVWKIDLESGETVGRASVKAINSAAHAKAVWVDGHGDVWVPGTTAPELYRFDADLKLVATYSLSSYGITNPEGIVASEDNGIYVTDRGGSYQVYKFQLTSDQLSLDEGWGDDGRVAIGPDVRQPGLLLSGDLVVGPYGGSGLFVLSAETGELTKFADAKQPYHITADHNDNVYVAHYGDTLKVTAYNLDGDLIGSWNGTDLHLLSEASGITISPNGERLYVIDQRPSTGGTVREYEWQE